MPAAAAAAAAAGSSAAWSAKAAFHLFLLRARRLTVRLGCGPRAARRRFQRGLKRKALALIKKLRKAKKEAPAGEKPEAVSHSGRHSAPGIALPMLRTLLGASLPFRSVRRSPWRRPPAAARCWRPPAAASAAIFPTFLTAAACWLARPQVRTHLRNMVIIPEMIGSVVGVYNGKTFNQVRGARAWWARGLRGGGSSAAAGARAPPARSRPPRPPAGLCARVRSGLAHRATLSLGIAAAGGDQARHDRPLPGGVLHLVSGGALAGVLALASRALSRARPAAGAGSAEARSLHLEWPPAAAAAAAASPAPAPAPPAPRPRAATSPWATAAPASAPPPAAASSP